MARMVRKQVCIPDELDEQLESLAASRHVSQASLVRAALEAYVEREAETKAARIAAAERFVQAAREIRKHTPPGWKRLTREQANDREFIRRLERDSLHGPREPKE